MSLSVETQRLIEAAVKADDCAEAIRDELKKIEQEVAAVLGAGWAGGAARSWREDFDEWEAGAREVADSLRDQARALRANARAYAEAEAANTTRVEKAGAQLSGRTGVLNI